MIVAQTIGIVAMLLGWYANSRSDDRALFRCNAVAALLTAVHFGLMGSPLAMSNQLVNATRFSLCRLQPKHLVAGVFAALALAQGVLLAQHSYEWLVVAASMLSAYLLCFASGSTLRLGLFSCSLLNLVFSLQLMSVSGVIFHLVNLVLLVRAYLQLRTVTAA